MTTTQVRRHANLEAGLGKKGEVGLISSWTEEITLSTGGTATNSSNNLPANSLILGVAWRVTQAIATASDWVAGVSGDTDRFVNSAGSTLTLDSTGVGLNQHATAGELVNTTATPLLITTTGTPTAGKIRLTVYYVAFTAPQSS